MEMLGKSILVLNFGIDSLDLSPIKDILNQWQMANYRTEGAAMRNEK